MKNIALALLALAFLALPAQAADPENLLLLETTKGQIVIEMRPDIAPKHVARYKELARQGFYDGITFHRVIEGFMAQAGDPEGTGAGGSGVNIPAEFSREQFVRGVVGAARKPNDINSADSQFFIMFAPQPSLNGDYTVWGKVVEGMEVADKINRCEPRQTFDQATRTMVMKQNCRTGGSPDKIIRAAIAADEAKTK